MDLEWHIVCIKHIKGVNMKIKVIKKNRLGDEAAQINAEFSNVSDYMKFLEQLGIDISLEDATYDMQREQTEYTLPLEL